MKPGNRFLPLLLVASLLSGCAAEGGSLTVGEDSGTMVPDAPLVVYYSFSGEVEQMAREISDMTGGGRASGWTRSLFTRKMTG